MDVERSMFIEWLRHPVTLAVMKSLEEEKAELLESLGEGVTIADSAGKTAVDTALAVGEIRGIEHCLNIKFSDADED